VRVTSSSPWSLEVAARCEGTETAGFVVAEPELAAFVRSANARATEGRLEARGGHGLAELTYTVDLDGLARASDDIDVARRFGTSLLAPASSFLLVPDPPEDGVPIRVHFDSPGIESGLRASHDGDGFAIESHELKVGTYTTFGAPEARDVALDDAALRVVLLDGKLDLPPEELARWVSEAAGGVATFFGAPPDVRTLVALAPLPGRHGVAFGKLLPESGPGIVVLLGEHTTLAELHDDWVLVHELFHVGTPSYLGEGKWYDEGLATYFEPLIRVRLGWRTERELWTEFARDMPRGLGAMERRGLDHPSNYSDVYWGGAIFCLLADLETRRQSDGTRGLEDGVRAVFAAGGVSSEVWTLAQATDLTDRALGAPVLATLEAAHQARGTPVDLRGVLRSLGVTLGRDGRAVLDEHAELAPLRHAITYGTPR
jgi:hypothetical protein